MTAHIRTKIFVGTVAVLTVVCVVCAGSSRPDGSADRSQRRLVTSSLGLTDLALWFEAMHTRHPSQADMFSAFGDYPAALEHFPSGSLAPPLQVRSGLSTPAEGAPK